MPSDIDNILKKTFKISENEGENKVVPLGEAVKNNVEPKMTLHIAIEANAAINEIIRQFYGKQPEFTLVMPGIIATALNLIYCGLIKKTITSSYSFLAPFMAPSAIARNAYKTKSVEFEDWTLCSISQRLMAGAMGLAFMPTKSITGSSIAKENENTFKTIADPFGSDKNIGLAKALNPDISIIHAWAADPYGNTIISPASPGLSWDSHLWGSKASKKGIIVTVEKVVTTDFIRKHSSLVRLPGYMVKAVSPAPMGAHPTSFISQNIEEFEAYGDDYDFITSYKEATKNTQHLDAWIKEWILDINSHEDYINKVGVKKFYFLKNKAEKNSWESVKQNIIPNISLSTKANRLETKIIMASRVIRDIVLKQGYKIMLGGAGVAGLASWLAYYKLRANNIDIELLSGTGIFGFAPRPFDSFFGSIYNIPTCKILTDTLDIYGVIIGGTNASAISVMGAGQIDQYGNVNSTKIASSYITGSGGSNDAANASEVVIIAEQSPKRFVENVPYVTFCGDRVTTIVSSMGIFKKNPCFRYICAYKLFSGSESDEL
jgi:acyl CoA:acetate/3-ketoacid CoA transferase alpha subunit/acyl CoA:acetate/3-ketoacid CoA transferase beta subunit